MKICGVIAEYNPFHNGHALHLQKTRALLGQDTAIVACMSGNFVQRGEAALLPKHLRAQAAVLGGADLVLELPAPYALQSAEGFANAGVALLDSLGVVTDLSFGAECANTGLLCEVAQTMLEQQTLLDTLSELKSGIPYAAARERALYAQLQEQADIVRAPNNILALEYCKALLRRKSSILPHAVAREQAAHDSEVAGSSVASASYLRRLLREGRTEEAASYLPPESAQILQDALLDGMALTDTGRLECAMLDRLCRLSPADLAKLADASEGIEFRLFDAIRQGRSFDQICLLAKTKRYALSRIRRMLLCAYLGIERQEQRLAPPYARVLAFNDRGRQVLRAAAENTSVPLLTKSAHVGNLSSRARAIFDRESLCCDLYHLALPAWRELRCGDDYRAKPFYAAVK